MSADGDMVRTIEAMVRAVQVAVDVDEDFGVQVELWRKAARFIELSNKERESYLWGGSGLTPDEQAESINLMRGFWPESFMNEEDEGPSDADEGHAPDLNNPRFL